MNDSKQSPTALVVGGGPAGLIAAEHLAAAGLRVEVVEHMRSSGRKLQLAGRGGLNITHSEPFDKLLSRYGPASHRLEPALRRFGPSDLREWCATLGEPTWIGSSGRVFPESFRATPLLRSWLRRLESHGVRISTGCRWRGWAGDRQAGFDPHRSLIERVRGDVSITRSDVTVLALGGASWPRVGSDGTWVEVFRRAGIRVEDLEPANCGLRMDFAPAFMERFEGSPLKNVAVSAGREPVRGDVMVTSSGLEGGPIYAVSSTIRGLLGSGGPAYLAMDLQPDLTVEDLTVRLTARRRAKDSTSTWLRRCGLDPLKVGILREATGNNLPVGPVQMAALIKDASLKVNSLMPIERAISSAGGVALSEIDQGFMLEKMPGVFVAGEMLDWEAPTGGYLLQASFSTGVAAAAGALAWLGAESAAGDLSG